MPRVKTLIAWWLAAALRDEPGASARLYQIPGRLLALGTAAGIR